MSKKRKSNDEFNFELGFENSSPKKPRKSEDAVMSDSVSGISRSGRIRKKSAKLMEMEDLESPEMDPDVDSKNRKKQLKTSSSVILPTEELEPDGSRKVAPIKIWSRPPGSSKQSSDNATSGPVVLTAVPASGYISDHPNLPMASGRNLDTKSSKKQNVKTEMISSKIMSPLKVNVGESTKMLSGDEHIGRQESSLRLKLILSPNEKGSSGETDCSGSEASPNKNTSDHEKKKRKKPSKHLGNSNRNTIDLLSGRGSSESLEQKSKIKTKKPINKDRAKQIVMSPSVDDSPEVDIGDSELGDSAELVIAEPLPKIVKKKKPPSKKSPDIKSKVKMLSETPLLRDDDDDEDDDDESSDADDVDSTNTAISTNSMSHSRSVYLAEKKKGKKKKPDKLPSKNDKKKGRPMTAYMLWCREYRRQIVADNPDMDFATISRRLGEAWHMLHDKEKLSWRRKAKRLSAKGSNLINTSKGNDQSRSKLIVKPQKTQSTDSDGSTSLRDLYKVVGTAPLDVAAHLKLLGESLSIIGQRLTEHEGQIAVSGSLSVLLDSTLCALGPLLCLTAEVPEMSGCSQEKLAIILDNIAYIMPGL